MRRRAEPVAQVVEAARHAPPEAVRAAACPGIQQVGRTRRARRNGRRSAFFGDTARRCSAGAPFAASIVMPGPVLLRHADRRRGRSPSIANWFRRSMRNRDPRRADRHRSAAPAFTIDPVHAHASAACDHVPREMLIDLKPPLILSIALTASCLSMPELPGPEHQTEAETDQGLREAAELDAQDIREAEALDALLLEQSYDTDITHGGHCNVRLMECDPYPIGKGKHRRVDAMCSSVCLDTIDACEPWPCPQIARGASRLGRARDLRVVPAGPSPPPPGASPPSLRSARDLRTSGGCWRALLPGPVAQVGPRAAPASRRAHSLS